MPKQVLVIEDGRGMAEALRHRLPGQRYAVTIAGREQALQALDSSPDLIVLDGLSAPAQALDVAKRLQQRAPGVRVVAVVPPVDGACDGEGVTCRSNVPTEDELVGWLGDAGHRQEGHVLRVGEVALDLESRELSVRGETSVLTPKLFGLLALLMSHPGQVFTRKQIMKQVWDTDYTGDTRTLDVHIHSLRRKLGDVPGVPRHVLTVRRVGYRFADPDSESVAGDRGPNGVSAAEGNAHGA